MPQGMIVEAFLPNCGFDPLASPGFTRAVGFDAPHQTGKGLVSQGDEPMQMIRHDDPGKRNGPVVLMSRSKFSDQQSAELGAPEMRRAVVGGRGEQVRPPRFGVTPAPKATRARGSHRWHSVAFVVWMKTGRYEHDVTSAMLRR